MSCIIIPNAFLSAMEAEKQSRAPVSSPSSGFTIDREGNIIDLATGEIDDCLMAQLGLGIVSAREFLRATRESQGRPVDAVSPDSEWQSEACPATYEMPNRSFE